MTLQQAGIKLDSGQVVLEYRRLQCSGTQNIPVPLSSSIGMKNTKSFLISGNSAVIRCSLLSITKGVHWVANGLE